MPQELKLNQLKELVYELFIGGGIGFKRLKTFQSKDVNFSSIENGQNQSNWLNTMYPRFFEGNG